MATIGALRSRAARPPRSRVRQEELASSARAAKRVNVGEPACVAPAGKAANKEAMARPIRSTFSASPKAPIRSRRAKKKSKTT